MPVAHGGRPPALALLAALTAFAPMATDLYLPSFPQIAETFGVTTSSVQVTLAASFLGLGAGQLLYGPLSDRFGRRRPLLAGLLVFVMASVGCALATSLAGLTAFRVIQALGGCAGLVIARAIVRDCYNGAAMARAFSIVMAVFALAPLLAPALGAALLGLGSWRVLFGFLAAFGIACMVAASRLPETLPESARSSAGVRGVLAAYAGIARNPDFARYATIAGLASLMLFTYISSSPGLLMAEHGFSATGFAMTFGGISLAMVAGSQANIRLLRHHPVRRLLRAYLAVQVVGTLALVVLSATGAPVGLVIAALVLSVGGFGGTAANAVSQALEPFPRAAGSASALVGIIQFGLGATISAALSVTSGRPSMVMGVVMAGACLAALTIAVTDRREVPASQTPVA